MTEHEPDAVGTDAASRHEDRVVDPKVVGARERFGAFYAFYIGLFILLFAYVTTVRIAEALLDLEFQSRVDRAIVVTSFNRSVSQQMKERIDAELHDSWWIRWGGLDVQTLVLAQDATTWLYVDGHGTIVPPGALAPADLLGEWMDYLPATASVDATLPHNALFANLVLIGYSTILLFYVYVTNRRLTGRESERLDEVLDSRNDAALHAAEIEDELAATRSRLSEIEPVEREQGEEIEALQRERHRLESQLGSLAQREEALRGRADQALDLAQEVRALEDLLEEVSGDLESKDGEIDRLEQNLAKASRSSGKTRSKQSERLARRFRTLYKTIEIEDRAIDDLAGLGDEALRLKAEESIKRLAEEADNVAVRRKVGGLPDGIQVFELGFAGKGRIYYAKGKSRRFRILLVGAKNTQNTDLDFLRRLAKDEFN
jgi:hypothetical protein